MEPTEVTVTIDHTEPKTPLSRLASSIQAPRIGFGSTGRAGFSGETRRLLRGRLIAYTGISLAIMILGFIMAWRESVPLMPMRIAVLSALVASLLVLLSDRDLSLAQLRGIELGSFFAIIIQVCLMSWLRIESSALSGDVGESLLASQFLYTLICLAILTYGIFIPNSWRRASAVLLPVSLLPLGLTILLQWTSREVNMIYELVELKKPIPESVIAALIAIYGSHVIQGVRREAFQAKQLGQYILKDLLGKGGMGEVYRAEHRMLKRPCAIKLIHADSESSEQAIDRFEQEVRSTAQLSHWNSVEVYDYGRTDDGTFYYVMELLPGANLDQIVRNTGSMSTGRAIHFLTQVCDALWEAHALGLVHRDIKPANVFASVRGGVNDVAKLLDFGLVRQSTDDAGAATGFAGTPSYMAPEQATSFNTVDGRADIYALGAVGFFLVAGRPPFQNESVAKLMLSHRRDSVPHLPSLNDQIGEDFDAVIQRCMAKAPEDRFPDVMALKSELLACNDAGAWTQQLADQWWKSHDPTIELSRSATQVQAADIADTIDSPAK